MPSNLPPDYEKEYEEQLQRNDQEVLTLSERRERGMLKKINTFATRHRVETEDITEKIKTDELFRAFSAKDPAKQKIHENIAGRYIKKIDGVTDFKQLPHAGLSLLRGAVIPHSEVRRQRATSRAKTIDFSWKFCGKQFFASHKYTRGRSGGSQGNQYKDLQEFVREANESMSPDQFFIAICDGDYYQGRDATSGSTRTERLKDLANKRNVFAMPINELQNWLIEFCKNLDKK